MKKFKLTDHIRSIRGLIEYEKMQFNDQLCQSYNLYTLFDVNHEINTNFNDILRLFSNDIILKIKNHEK